METRDLAKEIGALDDLFAFLGEQFDRHEVSEHTAFCVKLAAEELFANMVQHNEGASDHISLAVEVTDEQIYFHLVDYDVEPFDATAVPPPDVEGPIQERKVGGLGLHLVKSVVDRLSYDYHNRRMTVSVVKRRGS